MSDVKLSRHPFAPEVLSEPWDFYAEVHRTAPVFRVPGTPITYVAGYDELVDVLGRVEDFSNDFGGILSGRRAQDPEVKAILDTGWPAVDTLLTADPPVHTRFRKLVNLAFSMKRVDAIEHRIREITVRLIEDMLARADRGEVVDFVADFAIPLPVAVIAGEIGMDSTTDVATVKRWSDAFADRLGQMISREREIECAREVVEFQHHAKTLIDARRAQPTDDLLNDLVYASVDGEKPLDDAEIMSILQQLMVAGNETTTSTLAGGLLLLIQNPDQLAKVRADRRLIPNMVEEMLRLESPTSGLWRVVKRDTTVGGVEVKAGTMLMARFAAANRDPRRFPDPDRFDVARPNARTHLAFGRGIHMCVGNMLSRRELVVAFEELLDRVAEFALAPGARLEWKPNMLLRGLSALPVVLKRAVKAAA
ncbi:MAG: cytochrome P450 [Sphingomonadaceae bacterium]|uniref:cytochrome P450 n=1 Tax=Thermaurantiacus sp. TaxID=2820283 RepID=UPI00298EF45B|nr:cytochrome P450 [Thermaurantiacus sp.]MCS6987155.1 cytochrome P450 [Sphingomonadaceae bacterium]MDW8415811.1 cytochrome P450 [Thermaurantiacus sp.]